LKLQAAACPNSIFMMSSDLLPGHIIWTPPYFEQFLFNLPSQAGKPAFLLNTFGVMPGQVLVKMERLLTAKGFMVLDGYSFHTPESYPPYIIKGWHSLEAPTPKEMIEFENFATRLAVHLRNYTLAFAPKPAKIKLDVFSRFIPPYSLKKVRREMDPLSVDTTLCNQCGTCQQVCLYDAIQAGLPPVFVSDKCMGCWACFNHCPQQAIFTARVRRQGQYPQPAATLTAKLVTTNS